LPWKVVIAIVERMVAAICDGVRQAQVSPPTHREEERPMSEDISEDIIGKIKWLGHDGFKITAESTTVVIDPFRLSAPEAADLILVTHAHPDHCSPEDIAKCLGAASVIVTEPESAEKIRAARLCEDIRVVRPGDRLTVKGIPIEAVPAYNTNKHFHPKEKNWLGFIITVDGQRVYHAGDTDLIPEMDALSVDAALLPVSGTYVMTAAEAVDAAKRIEPKVAVPMHFNAIVGTGADADAFRQALAGVCEVVVLEI
jgi:L-ascorbate metabolism protein UlaG (beta-lactamase superfamily)